MSKRVNFSEYEKQIILTYAERYAHITEDKRTGKRTLKEKDVAWEALILKFNAEAGVTKRTNNNKMVGWLFLAKRPFETVFQFISGRLPESEREKEKRNDRREKKCPNNPHPHLLQIQ